ncbi:MAG: hypothetical protein K2O18_19540, partial [Oscillospiraceae bacterium]|nr:hypothetical protein [Oscillospiraceae bacterium]
MADFFLFRQTSDTSWPWPKKAVYYGYRTALLFCAGFCMGLVLLVPASGPYSKELILSYLTHWETLLLNTLPVALLTVLLYGMIGIAWPSFLAASSAFFALSLGNYYKLQFRSDPVYFEDLFNLREATNMAGSGHYSLFITKKILLPAFCLILGTVLLRLLAPGKKRCLPTSAVTVAVTACLVPLYVNQGIYDGLENFDYVKRCNPSENYISHGFLYPFFHSAAELIDFTPTGY